MLILFCLRVLMLFDVFGVCGYFVLLLLLCFLGLLFDDGCLLLFGDVCYLVYFHDAWFVGLCICFVCAAAGLSVVDCCRLLFAGLFCCVGIYLL